MKQKLRTFNQTDYLGYNIIINHPLENSLFEMYSVIIKKGGTVVCIKTYYLRLFAIIRAFILVKQEKKKVDHTKKLIEETKNVVSNVSNIQDHDERRRILEGCIKKITYLSSIMSS